jgi:predicted KAP-like P-loop ATPase
MQKTSNIIDKPRKEGAEDLLGVDKYTDALIHFIESCQMPTTLAIQGEWGSGKTSLLNQIRHRLCESALNTKEINNEKPFYGIWVNTWQYSLMKSKDEALISIIGGLTNEILSIVKEKHETKSRATINKVKGLFSKLGKVGAKAAATTVGLESDLFDSLLESEEGEVNLLQFKQALQDAINECLEEDRKSGNNNRGFIFFIDDLDRIDPPVAVEILELIKNIFEVENCLFVLAIDYEVVVKGLVPKFGPLTDKNEREFRSFFDKIIQLPFSMPVASYDVTKFLIHSLEDIGYIDDRVLQNEFLKEKLADLTLLSVGTNPRSLKRLINTLSLLNIIGKMEGGQEKEVHELLINYALVCIQIAYPKIYELLNQEPAFREWTEQTAKKLRLPELTESQLIVLNTTSEFDEEWEKVLFRKCQQDPYMTSRSFQISQLLNYVIELVPENLNFSEEISRIIGFSAVTSVNLDVVPKAVSKGEKVRFEGFAALAELLKGNKHSADYISTLNAIHHRIEQRFKDLIQINYTPNFITFTCKYPSGRSKTFLFIRFKKNNVQFEFSGQTALVSNEADLTEELVEKLAAAFNNLSERKA